MCNLLKFNYYFYTLGTFYPLLCFGLVLACVRSILPVVLSVVLLSCCQSCYPVLVRACLPVACCYDLLLSSSIIIIYYYYPLSSFIIYVLRSGVHVMGSGPALLSIHPRACLGALSWFLEFIFWPATRKNSYGSTGGMTRIDGRGVGQACLSHPRL